MPGQRGVCGFQYVGSCTQHLSSSSHAWGLVQCTVKVKCPREVAAGCSGLFQLIGCSGDWGVHSLGGSPRLKFP